MGGEMHVGEDLLNQAASFRLNQAASFLPMTGSYLDEDSDGTLPCLTVGGVQVYAYFEDGVLRVSVDTETSEPEAQNEEGEVPIEFAIDGRVFVRAGGPARRYDES